MSSSESITLIHRKSGYAFAKWLLALTCRKNSFIIQLLKNLYRIENTGMGTIHFFQLSFIFSPCVPPCKKSCSCNARRVDTPKWPDLLSYTTIAWLTQKLIPFVERKALLPITNQSTKYI